MGLVVVLVLLVGWLLLAVIRRGAVVILWRLLLDGVGLLLSLMSVAVRCLGLTVGMLVLLLLWRVLALTVPSILLLLTVGTLRGGRVSIR